MAAISYSRRMLIQRIQRHMANGFPNNAFVPREAEIRLYLDEAIAFNIVGTVWAGAKITGVMEVPEGFLVTSILTDIAQNENTGYWFATLPNPPLSLPLGFSITDCYFAMNFQRSQTIIPLTSKRVSYRDNMPMPTGTFYWVEGNKIYLWATENQMLYGYDVFVTMPMSRTDDINAVMPLPDDVIENVFNNVVEKCKDRMGIPKDIVHDDLPSGNKSS